MIVERERGKTVLIRRRDPVTLERIEERISDVYPYCFVQTEVAPVVDCLAKKDGFKGVYGEDLTKLIFNDPYDVGQLKKSMKTWEANIPFVNRVLADKLTDYPNYQHRVWYLDMEWSIHSEAITAITVLDSYTEKVFTWFVCNDSWTTPGPVQIMPCVNHPEGLEEVVFDTPALAFETEAEMLRHFVKHLNKHDPDVITGWYVVGADIQVLSKRLDKHDIGRKSLSPMNRHRYEYDDDWSQPIPGRLCIDLMGAFGKLYQMKNGKLPNMKLDTAAREALGEGKVALPDGHNTYYSDIGTYIDYNRKDVTLLPRLNAVNNTIEYFLAIQHIVQCDIRSTPYITKIFTILALRDKDFDLRIPSRPQFSKVDYQGADIMEPTPGVYENIAIFDVRAMYHSNVAKYGISWETISEDGEDIGNGLKFDRGKPGLLERQMDHMTVLRDEYKEAMWAAENDEQRRRFDALQYATKSLVASMYGAAGDSRYGLYHPDVAAAITYASRNTLGELRRHCEDMGHDVIYGHTDSVFVKIPDPNIGYQTVNALNVVLAPIVTEFEKWCESVIIVAKNRYACKVVWSDGEEHPPSTYIKGIEMKQSRMPQVMKHSMTFVVEALLDGQTPQHISNHLVKTIDRVINKDYPWQELCMQGRLERDLSDYKVLSEARAGADWANRSLGKHYGKGSSFLVTLDSNENYIAFDDIADLRLASHFTELGYKAIAERFIVRKVEPYFILMGEDPIVLTNALNGLGAMAWP